MSDRIKKIKVKKADGSMTDYIPIGVDAENVDFDNGYKLNNIVGSINPDESGSIAVQLSKSIKYYDCIADMKADTTLNGGGAARTLGYYEPGDGGGAIYNIVEDDTLIDDGGSVHDLDNGLKAKLVIENNTINIKQLGGENSWKNHKRDIQPYILKYLNIIDTVGKKITLYIPSGFYYSTPCNLSHKIGWDIYGDWPFSAYDFEGTVISSYNDNQDYIFKIGNNEYYTANWSLKNIRFTTVEKQFENKTASDFTVKNVKTCLSLVNTYFAEIDNLFIEHVKGRGITISTSWELYFKLINFRYVDNLAAGNNTDGILYFDRNNNSLSDSPNISATTFENLMFERTLGVLIGSNSYCSFENNKFGVINFENAPWNKNEGTYTGYNKNNVDTEVSYMSMFSLGPDSTFNCTIGEINCNNYCNSFYTLNENNYAYTTLFHYGNKTEIHVICNDIHIGAFKRPIYLIHSYGGIYAYKDSSIIINNIMVFHTTYPLLTRVFSFPCFKVNNMISSAIDNNNYYDKNTFPFYELMTPKSDESGGCIITRENSTELPFNALKLAVIPRDHTTSIRIINQSNNLLIRALIANNHSVTLKFIIGESSSTVTFSGTGKFKNYYVEDIATLLGITEEEVKMSILTIQKETSTDAGIWLDCYRNY